MNVIPTTFSVLVKTSVVPCSCVGEASISFMIDVPAWVIVEAIANDFDREEVNKAELDNDGEDKDRFSSTANDIGG